MERKRGLNTPMNKKEVKEEEEEFIAANLEFRIGKILRSGISYKAKLEALEALEISNEGSALAYIISQTSRSLNDWAQDKMDSYLENRKR